MAPVKAAPVDMASVDAAPVISAPVMPAPVPVVPTPLPRQPAVHQALAKVLAATAAVPPAGPPAGPATVAPHRADPDAAPEVDPVPAWVSAPSVDLMPLPARSLGDAGPSLAQQALAELLASTSAPVRPSDARPSKARPIPTRVAVPAQVSPPVVPAQVAVAPHASRVNLGFRDGTTAALDPTSEQAAALEELAVLLSLRD